MKKDRNYYAQYGFMQPREIKPFDVNIEPYNPPQIQLPSIQGQEQLQQTGNPGMSGGLGSAALSGLRGVGQVMNAVMTGGPQLINALLPDQPLTREDRTLPRAYNPYPQGTGSQAIYRKGGKVKKNDVFTSLSDEEAAYYYNNNIPLPREETTQPLSREEEFNFMSPQSMQPLDTRIPFMNVSQVPLPEQSKRIEFERLLDRQGNAQYAPIFSNNYNYSEAVNAMQQLPEFFGEVPVVRSPELYRDLRQNFNPSSSGFDWAKLMQTFEKGGMLIPYTVAESGIHIKKENKGKFTESAKRAGMGVQEFASKVLANKEDYSSTQVKRANFAKNATKFKHENGGYVQGQELDLSMEEIRRLQDLGYELEF